MCGPMWVPCATQLPILLQLWLQAVPRKAEMQGATSWVGRVDLEANQVNAKPLQHWNLKERNFEKRSGFSFSKARHITKSGRSSIKALAGHVKMFARVSPKVCSYDEHRKKRIQKHTETIHMNIQYIYNILQHIQFIQFIQSVRTEAWPSCVPQILTITHARCITLLLVPR